MDTSPPVVDQLADRISFPVSYQAFGTGEYNARLKGKGTVTVSSAPRVFRFTGRKRGWFFGGPSEVTLTEESICNVEISGKKIQLQDSSGSSKQPFLFYCRTADEALAVAALLPRRVDADFTASQDFHARLRELSASHPLASVTNLIVAANVVVFLVMAGVLGAGWIEVTDLSAYIRYGANNGAATTDGQWWRLLTSMFMHYGVIHLALNMWALFQSGHILERMQGRAIYAVTYFASGIGGGLLSIIWNRDRIWSAGASGAIFGVIGALIGYLMVQKQAMPKAVFQPMLKSTLMFAAYNLFYGMVHPGIDNSAHIGGFVTGIAMGGLTALPLEPISRAKLALSRLIRGLVALVALIAIGIAGTPRFNYSVREEFAWHEAIKGTAEKEKELMTRLNDLLQRWDQKADNGGDIAKLVEGEIIPFYTDLAKRIDAVSLAPGHDTTRRRDALRNFIGYRLKGFPHLLAGVRESSDQEIRDYQAFEKLATEAIAGLKAPG